MTLFKRRHVRALIRSTVALGLISRGAQAKDTPEHITARHAIDAAYARCARASLKNDIPTVLSYFTPDFHYIGLDGRELDYSQYAALCLNKGKVKGLQYDKIKQSIEKVQWRGDDLAVWALSTTHTSYKGNRLSIIGHVRDYWRHTPEGWKVSQTVALNTSTWMNGKLVSKAP